jgi:hypothetical protein
MRAVSCGPALKGAMWRECIYSNPPILYIFSSPVDVCRRNPGNIIIEYTVLLLCREVLNIRDPLYITSLISGDPST